MKGPRLIRKKAINSEKDPYLSQLEPGHIAVCKKCDSVYYEKRWFLKSDAPDKAARADKIEVLCPACRKIKDGFAEGFVRIQGDFTREHRDEILHLIRNKEELAKHLNPLSRIMEIKETDEAIEITTTTEKLAQRIGKILTKAFHGTAEYKWSDDVKLARVVWTRQE